MSFSGKRLKNARKYKNLTIDQLIKEVNEKQDVIKLTNGMVSKWENNKVTPRIEAIQILSDFLDVPSDYLLGKKDFGNTHLDLRLEAGLSVKELSSKSGVNENLIILIEAGLRSPNKIELNRLGEVFGFSDFHYFLLEQGVTVYEEDINILLATNGLNASDEIDKIIHEYSIKTQENEAMGYKHDLYTILEESNSVYFKDRQLSIKEREAIIKIIENIFEFNKDQ